MRVWVAVVGVVRAVPALAQAQQPEIVIDAKQGSTVEREPTTQVIMPPQGPERDAFLAGAIAVDVFRNEVSLGGKPLPARDFYRRLGRPDLAAWSEDRTRQRVWLMSGGGLVLVAGVVSGALVLASGPDTSSPACQTGDPKVYSDCASRAEKAQMGGALLAGAGLALGGALIVWGMNVPEMVTSVDETRRLATEYNETLSRKLGGSPPAGLRWQLRPALAPGYAGLVARLTF